MAKKTEVPRSVFELLGLTWSEAEYTSNFKESGGGGTVKKDAWVVILDRLVELKENKKLLC